MNKILNFLLIIIILLCIILIIFFIKRKNNSFSNIEEYKLPEEIEVKIDTRENCSFKKKVTFKTTVDIYDIPIMKRKEYPEYFGDV